jgi:hypothetical protein
MSHRGIKARKEREHALAMYRAGRQAGERGLPAVYAHASYQAGYRVGAAKRGER